MLLFGFIKQMKAWCVKFKFANFWGFVCKHQSNINIDLNMVLFALIFYKF